VRVAERNRERVRLILADQTRLGQEPSHHEHHLLLRRGTLAHHGELHLGGRVFVDGRSPLPCREEDHPPNVPDLEGSERTLPDEGGFHGDLVRPDLVQERDEAVVDGEEAVGEWEGGAGGDNPGALVVDAGPVEEEKAEAGDPAPGIDPEDPDGPGPCLRRQAGRGFARLNVRPRTPCSLARPSPAIGAWRGGPS